MKITANLDNMLAVDLSRKNIEGLLAQLDDARNGVRDTPQIMRTDESGVLVIITASENDIHYGERLSGQSHDSQAFGEGHVKTTDPAEADTEVIVR